MENTDKIKWEKIYGVASIITIIFMSFIISWVFLIPIAVLGLLIYGYIAYMKERKNRISVNIKPTESMRAIMRREEELKREKQKAFEDFQRKI